MQKVRLSDKDLEQIKLLFRKFFGEDDHLWLFGSRVDLTRRGGDIDLYIETREVDNDITWKKERSFRAGLQNTLGEQKIDVVTNILPRKFVIPIYNEAKSTGVMLI